MCFELITFVSGKHQKHKRRRTRDSNPQPASRHLISSQAANQFAYPPISYQDCSTPPEFGNSPHSLFGTNCPCFTTGYFIFRASAKQVSNKIIDSILICRNHPYRYSVPSSIQCCPRPEALFIDNEIRSQKFECHRISPSAAHNTSSVAYSTVNEGNFLPRVL